MKMTSVALGFIILIVAFTIHSQGTPMQALVLGVVGLVMLVTPFVIAYHQHS
jgi:hypothetical protein